MYFPSPISPIESAWIDRSGLAFLIAGLSFLTIGVFTTNAFFQCEYVQLRDHSQWTVTGGYSIAQFTALVIGTYTLPAGVIFMLIYAVQSFKSKWGYYAKVVAYFSLGSGFVVCSVYSYIQAKEILECGIFCMQGGAEESSINNAAIVWVGLLYFIFSFSFAVLYLGLSLFAYMSRYDPEPSNANAVVGGNGIGYSPIEEIKPLLYQSQSGSVDGSKGKSTPLVQQMSLEINSKNKNDSNVRFNSNSRKRIISVTVVLLVFTALYPLLFFAATALPTWWNGFTAYGIQENLADVPSKAYGFYWSLSVGNNEDNAIVLKLFPDILVYYLAIYAVAIVALLAEAVPAVRVRLHSKPWFLYKASVGESLLFITILCLAVGLFLYWYFDHGWEQKATTTRTNEERAARAIGQVANMVTGLLVLPVTRNSVWHVLLGTSWETMIAYHHYFGYLLISLVITHVGLWWKVYSQKGTFPHDIFAVPQTYHADNFTVPLAVVSTVTMLVAMGGLSHYIVRRANYDAFYWAHHISLVVFLVMLWHSTMR